MTRERTATITICRTVFISGCEQDTEIEVEVTGTVNPPEPDVGIFSWWAEVESAVDPDGAEVELTDKELDQACLALEESASEAVAREYEP